MEKMKRVCDVWELLAFCEEIHYNAEDFTDGDIDVRVLSHLSYELKEVPLEKVEEARYYICDDLIKEYEKMNLETMPPIILDEPYKGTDIHPIIDGGHRVTVKRKLNQKTILAYVPVPSTRNLVLS